MSQCMSDAAVAGIAASALIGIALIAFAAWFYNIKRRERQEARLREAQTLSTESTTQNMSRGLRVPNRSVHQGGFASLALVA